MTDFYLIDAFADAAFTGNPAAVVPLPAWLPEETLQAIAAEHNLSDTAFFVPAGESAADYEIRWFTPRVEVPLCGHATLATGHVLFQHLGYAGETLRLKTRKKGLLTLHKVAAESYAMTLPAAAQTSFELDPALAHSLNLTVLEAYEGSFLTLVLPDAQGVASYQPDFTAIKALGKELIITAAGGTAPPYGDFDFVSRVFAPNIGVNEDPVTGAAHCQLVPYWSLIRQKTALRAAQIGPRGGRLKAELHGTQVTLIGQARTYATGQIYL